MIEVARAEHTAPNVDFRVSPGESPSLLRPSTSRSALPRSTRCIRPTPSSSYEEDDIAGLEAEAGARAKGHPNYFTDVRSLMGNTGAFGFRADVQRYYRRRGNFGTDAFTTSLPARFYEYLLVLSKIGEARAAEVAPMSSPVSATFRRVRPGDAPDTAAR